MVDLSIVIPAYNEEKNIDPLYNEIKKNIPRKTTFEIIFVNDGSFDDTLLKIKKISIKDKNVKLINLNRNRGQSKALYEGIANSKGKYVITMDADLQNDPSDINIFYKEIIKNDIDCIVGWRKERFENNFFRVIVSKIANFMIRKILNLTVNDLGCSFKCFKREIFSKITWATDFHRYFSAFVIFEGFNVREIQVKHNKRNEGSSNYGYNRVFNVLVDVIFLIFLFGSLKKPLYFFGKFALFFFTIGTFMSFLAIYLKLANIREFSSSPLPELIIFLYLTSLIVLFFGILSELVLALFSYLKNKGN